MASSRSLHTVHLAAFGAGNVVGLGVMYQQVGTLLPPVFGGIVA